jgi:glycosyltransferase involved in cell wall biosynthesis
MSDFPELSQLTELITQGRFSEAKQIAEKLPDIVQKENAFGMIYYYEGKLDDAVEHFKKAVEIDPINSDVLFNYGKALFDKKDYKEAWRYLLRIHNKDWAVYDLLGDTQIVQGNIPMALYYYGKAAEISQLEEMKKKYLEYKKQYHQDVNIAILCLPGLDNFIRDIADILGEVYNVRLVVSANGNEIVQAYEWADIVWLEWANELAVEVTNKLEKKGKKIICRLHSYEALTNAFLSKIVWDKVDTIVLVAEHMKDVLRMYHPDVYKRIEDKIKVIHNGLNLERFRYKPRTRGYNIAVVANINYKKDPTMWLQIMGLLKKIDPRYNLSIAGDFQDYRYHFYFHYFIEEAGLRDNVKLFGYVNNIEEFLEDKNYVLSTSVHEGHPYNIMEAMAAGIKPIIHNYVGAKSQWPKELVFDLIDEVREIVEGEYNSESYRTFVEDRYSIEQQIHNIKRVLEIIIAANSTGEDFSDRVQKNSVSKLNKKQEAFETTRQVYSNDRFSNILAYLKGEKFSSGLQVSFPKSPYVDRFTVLENICRGKRVIHLGFADHKELIETKIKNNVWLHARLMKVASVCYGIDINCEAVDFVKNNFRINNIFCADILNEDLPPQIKKEKIDLVVIPEVLEHTDNAVAFLMNLKSKLFSIVNEVVITVPNAFRISNFQFAKSNIEAINSDHRYWFTPYTLLKVLVRSGYEPLDIILVDSYQSSDSLSKEIPLLREDIIAVARFQ